MAGRKIDDHSFWAGGRSKASVFPEGVKTKMESSAEGAGELGEYWDTTEKIKEQQVMGERKIKSHMTKPGYRN
jgi:hypothetical protein